MIIRNATTGLGTFLGLRRGFDSCPLLAREGALKVARSSFLFNLP
jgi:hypothetical protein